MGEDEEKKTIMVVSDESSIEVDENTIIADSSEVEVDENGHLKLKEGRG